MELEPDNLAELIKRIEEEQTYLKRLIDEAVEEFEFGVAEGHWKQYRVLLNHVQRLRTLKNPRHGQLAMYYRSLTSLEKFVMENKALAKAYQPEIDQYNRMIDEIEKTKPYIIDTSNIADTLTQLLNGKIESFQLKLNKRKEWMFTFKLIAGSININYSYKKKSLSKWQKKRLRVFGFQKSEQKRNLIHCFPINSNRDPNQIITWLARVILDVLNLHDIDKPAELLINHYE